MSEESKVTPQEQATIEVITKMAGPLSDHARMSLMEDVFNTLEPDSMVDFTDFCNMKMGDVISHKAEIAGRMVGKKAGELFDTTRKNIKGLANKFSQEMGKMRGEGDRWSGNSNPYMDDNETQEQ